jgi:hypothetical protein
MNDLDPFGPGSALQIVQDVTSEELIRLFVRLDKRDRMEKEMNGEKVLSVEALEVGDCPFCHGSVINRIGVCTVSGYAHRMRVICPHCGSRGPIGETAEGAIRKWNLSDKRQRRKKEMEEIKPCPFCHYRVNPNSLMKYEVSPNNCIVCENCATNGPRCDTPEDARAAWNQRDPAPVVTPFAMKNADPATRKNLMRRSTSELVVDYCQGTLEPSTITETHQFAVAVEILKSRGVDIDPVNAAVINLLEAVGLSFEAIALKAFDAAREQEETK